MEDKAFSTKELLCLEFKIFIFSKPMTSFGRQASFFPAQLDFTWMPVLELAEGSLVAPEEC